MLRACDDFHPLKYMDRVECPNTRNSIGNGLPMEKHVGAVVRKSSQLIIDEEIDHFENKIPVQKKLMFP